jgi:hypothetical protein
LSITAHEEAYDFLFEFLPVLPTPVLAPLPYDEYAETARTRGIIEHIEAPTMLAGMMNHVLPGTFLPKRRGHSTEYVHTPSHSPFLPRGPWQRIYTTPFDPVVRAQMSSPQSIAPYGFAEALERLVWSGPMTYPKRLTVKYSGRPI